MGWSQKMDRLEANMNSLTAHNRENIERKSRKGGCRLS